MKKKKKGLLGGLVIPFIIALSVVLAVLIFLFNFKIHVIQTMVDYYLWAKHYNIPMALFSIDIYNEETGGYNSSIIVLNKIHYGDLLGKNYGDLEKKIDVILNDWFGTVGSYVLSFEDTTFISERGLTETGVKHLGVYPLPVVFNETHRVLKLSYRSIMTVIYEECKSECEEMGAYYCGCFCPGSVAKECRILIEDMTICPESTCGRRYCCCR